MIWFEQKGMVKPKKNRLERRTVSK
jgi:hypothetical protein